MTVARIVPIAALLVLLSGCAAAAPSTAGTPNPTVAPVTAVDLASGLQDGSVDVDVTGPTQVVVKEITLAPGAGTGLHCHDGQLIAVVESGVFTHYAPIYPTGVHVYTAGDSLVEGAHYVHQGKNEGTVPVVLTVTYVIPQGDPLAETDLSKCDPQ
jgi:quercetin dioxygenase-like cupin family protein